MEGRWWECDERMWERESTRKERENGSHTLIPNIMHINFSFSFGQRNGLDQWHFNYRDSWGISDHWDGPLARWQRRMRTSSHLFSSQTYDNASDNSLRCSLTRQGNSNNNNNNHNSFRKLSVLNSPSSIPRLSSFVTLTSEVGALYYRSNPNEMSRCSSLQKQAPRTQGELERRRGEEQHPDSAHQTDGPGEAATMFCINRGGRRGGEDLWPALLWILHDLASAKRSKVTCMWKTCKGSGPMARINWWSKMEYSCTVGVFCV